MEEKEKEECTGWDRCGAHTHSVTLSERVSFAHTRRELRSAQNPERGGKVAPAFAPDFLLWEVHLACLLSSLRNPVLAAQDPGNAGHRRHFCPRDCRLPRQQ